MSRHAGIHPPPAPPTRLDAARWERAATLESFIGGDIKSAELWNTTTRLARIETGDADAVQRAVAGAGASAMRPARLLVLLEDWCGDAIFTVPFASRLAESSPALELRVLSRDANPALMSTHLSGDSRSIPVVMLFAPDGIELGWWGPRPQPLQQWMLAEGLSMEKTERYKAVRTWYARDRGRTTVAELLTLLSLLSSQELRQDPRQDSPTATPDETPASDA